jgi:hypothetical protein
LTQFLCEPSEGAEFLLIAANHPIFDGAISSAHVCDCARETLITLFVIHRLPVHAGAVLNQSAVPLVFMSPTPKLHAFEEKDAKGVDHGSSRNVLNFSTATRCRDRTKPEAYLLGLLPPGSSRKHIRQACNGMAGLAEQEDSPQSAAPRFLTATPGADRRFFWMDHQLCEMQR